MPSAQIAETFEAVPQNVAALRHAAVAFAAGQGVPERVQVDIALAVSEAATNVVLHAYQGKDPPGPMYLEADAGPDAIRITVRDDGCGMQPRPDSPGVGLGLPLIAQLADELEVGSAGGTNIAMSFAVDARSTA